MFPLKELVFLFWFWTSSIFLPKAYSETGLQGVPTWISLGLKSPFIEFGSQEEQLANTSIPINITKDEQAYMHQEGLRKLGTFIKPVDLRDSETGFVKQDHTKRLTLTPPNLQSRYIHPIQEEMDQKNIILLDDDTDENGLPASLTDEDRKFIVPMALKNISPDPQWGNSNLPTVRLSNTKEAMENVSDRQNNNPTVHNGTPITQEMDPTSNIDDLKKHILFLHNMTKTNTNFESKFVKFPSLQKDKPKQIGTTSATNNKRPQRPFFQYAAPIAHPTRKMPQDHENSFGREDESNLKNEKSLNKLSYFPKPINKSSSVMLINEGTFLLKPQMNLLNKTESSTKESTNPLTKNTTDTETHLRTTKRPVCLRNPDSPKCLRQRRKEEQQRQRDRDEWFRGQAEYIQPRFQPIIQTINNTKRFAVSIEIPDSFKIQSDGEILLRAQRSPLRSRKPDEVSEEDNFENRSRKTDNFNQDIVMTSAEIASDREFVITNIEKNDSTRQNKPKNDSSNIPKDYFEPIDLNPKNCYKVSGLTPNQKKQCIKNTSVMPAISRGARAAIQECQFQFKNRRWNCSVTDDETVFGPITNLAAPEMAFIHALAAATVTSFIARACRDGQLASCGCSRGSRPKQLHDDWTWGGCGDNLEYAYKFATDFIDVREKEANRDAQPVTRKQIRETTIGSLTSEKTLKNFQTSQKNSTEFSSRVDNKMSLLKPNVAQMYIANENKKPNVTEVQTGGNSDDSSKTYLLELQQRISKKIPKSNIKGEELLELQDQMNNKIVNLKFVNGHSSTTQRQKGKRKNQRAVHDIGKFVPNTGFKAKVNYEIETISRSQQSTAKAKSLMNLHNNEAGRRAVIKKTRITCKCHGVSGSCSLITCWQQLSSIREIGDYLRVKYEEATKVKLNKRGRLQVKDSRYKIPTAHDLIYLDESPDWCRTSYMLQWPGTHGRVCRKNSSGLESCAILCCGRGYNTKNIIVKERCNCKFHWCCHVKCEVCTKVLEEHTCK